MCRNLPAIARRDDKRVKGSRASHMTGQGEAIHLVLL